MATQIARDPFGRASLMRSPVLRQHNLECDWCGRRARFYYYWAGDSINGDLGPRYGKTLRPFCSVGCYRAYYS